jgi:ketosteroid isomerase-like protein
MSERLARRWFATIQRGAYDELDQLVHADVELVSKVRPGTTIHGRSDVSRFIEQEVAPNLFEASSEVFTPLDDQRVIVEGRVRWIDDERVIRDDPVIWAVEFRDGLMLRFVATRTMLEAESVLARPAESELRREP